jgi:hypothetical protein
MGSAKRIAQNFSAVSVDADREEMGWIHRDAV